MRGSRRKGKSCNEASSGEDESEGSQDVTEENESKEERCAAEGPSEKDSNEKTKTISNIKKKASEVLEKWVPGKNKKEKGPDEGQVVGGSNESTKKAGSEVEGETTSGEEKPEGSEEQREGTSFQNGQGAEEGQHAQQSQQQWYPVPLCPTTFIHICCQHVPPGECFRSSGPSEEALSSASLIVLSTVGRPRNPDFLSLTSGLSRLSVIFCLAFTHFALAS